MAGVGMSLYFAPVANLVLSTVRRKEEGKASGVNNTIREVGGVFGVAVLASVFSAVGGYASPQAFVDGMTAAVWVGAIAVALAGVAAVADPAEARTSCRTRSRCSSAASARARPPASSPASRTRRRERSRVTRPDALARERGRPEAARALPPGARAASARPGAEAADPSPGVAAACRRALPTTGSCARADMFRRRAHPAK